jgi:hypothetical protein|tara:strand:+ start:329 stop:748 length:420 start_codon:yes stop_codon:yes gene_type:complete
MAIGNMLRERGEQYVANQDEAGTWRVLDTWHDALKVLEPDEDVPDSSPAVTIMSEGAFLSLMKEASRLGVLENASSLLGNEELNTQIRDLQEHIVELQSEKEVLMVQTKRSDTFELKHEALGAVLKLAAMGDMDEILKD